MKRSIIFLIFLFLSNILFSQLDENTLANLLVKATYFNKIKSDKFLIIYANGVEQRAKKIRKLVGGTAVISSTVVTSSDYQNVLYLGLSSAEIMAIRPKFKKVLSISDDVKNIEAVSLAFGVKNNGRPLIIVNLTHAKEEANFKSQFLKIAQVK